MPTGLPKTRAGYAPDLYPDVNWIDAISRDHAANQRITVDVSGGSENLRYSFVAAVYNERGILTRDKSLDWDPTIKLQRYNVRSNVDLKLSPPLKFVLISGDIFRIVTLHLKVRTKFSAVRSVSLPSCFPSAIHPVRFLLGRKRVILGQWLLRAVSPVPLPVRLRRCFLWSKT